MFVKDNKCQILWILYGVIANELGVANLMTLSHDTPVAFF